MNPLHLPLSQLEKAFNTPLMNYLNVSYTLGIGGKTLKWIDSFLCDRQQRETVNGVKPNWVPVLSGVPPGHRSWTSVVLVVH